MRTPAGPVELGRSFSGQAGLAENPAHACWAYPCDAPRAMTFEVGRTVWCEEKHVYGIWLHPFAREHDERGQDVEEIGVNVTRGVPKEKP